MHPWEIIHSKKSWGKYPNEELVRFIARKFFYLPFEKRKEISIMEIGTGQGANVWFLLREGFDVYGIDISKSAIEKMKKFLEENNLLPEDFHKRFIVEDMRSFSFEKRFDVVIDVASILHVSYTDHHIVYKNIYNSLEKDGYFWTLHLLKNSWGYGLGKKIDKDTFYGISEGPLKDQGTAYFADICDLVNLLEKTGFKIENKEIITRTYENGSKQWSLALIVAKKE